jgi:hypothetical protein
MSKNLNFAANVLNYRGPKWFKDFWGKGHYYKNQNIKNQKEHQKNSKHQNIEKCLFS